MSPLTFILEGKQVTLYPREIADILDWASDLTQRLAEDSAPKWQDAITEWESLIS